MSWTADWHGISGLLYLRCMLSLFPVQTGWIPGETNAQLP
jgi:hypothetical protein